MSIRLMSHVWLLEAASSDKLVLLKMADCAHDDGASIYPGVDRIVRETSLSLSTVKAAIARWLEVGMLVLEQDEDRARHWPRVYRLDVPTLMRWPRVAEPERRVPRPGVKDGPGRRARPGSSAGPGARDGAGHGLTPAGVNGRPIPGPTVGPYPSENHQRPVNARARGARRGRKVDQLALDLWRQRALHEAARDLTPDEAVRLVEAFERREPWAIERMTHYGQRTRINSGVEIG